MTLWEADTGRNLCGAQKPQGGTEKSKWKKRKRYQVGLESEGPNGTSLNRRRQVVLIPGNSNCASKKVPNQETARRVA